MSIPRLRSVKWLDYDRCDSTLGLRGDAPLAPVTRLVRNGNTFDVLYKGAPIVTFRADKTAVLNAGSHRTPAVMDRINRVLPPGMAIVEQDGRWLFRTYDAGLVSMQSCDYYDGMVIDTTTGKVYETADMSLNHGDTRSYLTWLIERYVSGFIDAIECHKVKQPDMADVFNECFACQFLPVEVGNAWDNVLAGVQHGAEWSRLAAQAVDSFGVEHLLAHLRQKEFHTHVFLNALRELDRPRPESIILALYTHADDTLARLRPTIRMMLTLYFTRRLPQLVAVVLREGKHA